MIDPRKEVLKEVNTIIEMSGVENAKELKDSLKLMGTCPCYGEKGKNKEQKEKVKKEPTARNLFMGECMRSAAKGGRGKGMTECSVEWKENKNENEVKK